MTPETKRKLSELVASVVSAEKYEVNYDDVPWYECRHDRADRLNREERRKEELLEKSYAALFDFVDKLEQREK